MNDKDRDLIQQVLSAAGTAGEKGFGYLVHYQAVSGAVSILGFGVLLASVTWAIRRLFAWKPDDEDVGVVRGIGIVVCCIAFVAFIFGFFDGITTALSPEGAAINVVLRK